MKKKMVPALWRQGAFCALTAAGLAVTQAQAQGPIEGTHSTISTSIGMEAGRNFDLDPGANDESARLYGALGYAYEKRTRQSRLSFSAQIHPETDDNHDNGLFPQGSLRWMHETARMRFSLDASYAEAKVTDQSIGFDETTGQILNYDSSGTRIQTRIGAKVEGGIDMPFGYTLSLDQSDIDYRDTGPENGDNPNTSTGAGLALRADISPMTQVNMTLNHRYYETEGSPSLNNRTTDMAMIGIQQRIDALTSISASVGETRIRTEKAVGPDETRDGLSFSISGTRLDPLGAYRFDFRQSQTQNGRRQDFTIGRNRETPFGHFSGMIGASKGEAGGTDWIGRISYNTELPRDTLTASMERSVQTDDDGDDVVVTLASAQIDHQLSEVNRLNFGLKASVTEYPSYDKSRLDATMRYMHDLTSTVSLEAGLTIRVAKTSEQETARSESVFLGLSRKFDFLH